MGTSENSLRFTRIRVVATELIIETLSLCPSALRRGGYKMKPGTVTHTIAVLLSSISSLFAHSTPKKAEPAKVRASKKSDKLSEDILLNVNSLAFTPGHWSPPPPEAIFS